MHCFNKKKNQLNKSYYYSKNCDSGVTVDSFKKISNGLKFRFKPLILLLLTKRLDQEGQPFESVVKFL